MDKVFETDRLAMYVCEQSNLPDARRFWGDEEVMSLCNGASSDELLLKILEGYHKCHHKLGLSVYLVTEKLTNQVIGAAGFNIVNSLEGIELLYHFQKESWGHGYASEAVAACIVMAENRGEVQKISASANLENKASIRILEKQGFTFKGMEWFDDTEQEEPVYEYVIR